MLDDFVTLVLSMHMLNTVYNEMLEVQFISVDGVATKFWCSSWWCRCVLPLVGFCMVNWLGGKFVIIDVVANCSVDMVNVDFVSLNKLMLVVIAIDCYIVVADLL